MQRAERKVLFILKEQTPTIFTYGRYFASPGLKFSARFTSNMLVDKLGFDSKVIEVIDNNAIDREVHKFKPTHVVIDALWVVPEKFKVLTRLHPNIHWIILVHSRLPFLSHERIAIEWIKGYLQYPNVSVGFNSRDTADSFREVLGGATKIVWLPNYYPMYNTDGWEDTADGSINIGCFGAIRPLKNQLIQAVAAIEFARRNNLYLYYHINSSRVEQEASPVLQNIRSLFVRLKNAELVEHQWLSHVDFITVMRTMQLSLQVSFSESYNLVTADAVANGIPVVVSDNIEWVNSLFYANPTIVESIVHTMDTALWYRKWFQWFRDINKRGLAKSGKASTEAWKKYLK